MRCGLLLVGILLATAGAASAQEGDLSQVEIGTTRLAANLYLLQGAGGNITASVGRDGVLLVDAEFAPLAGKIRAALITLGAPAAPVRFVIDTHYHSDHTHGNAAFAQAGATVIAHDEVGTRLASGGLVGNGGSVGEKMPPVEAAALPVITFDHELTVHLNGEDIRAVHYAHAHTGGDSIVFFPKANAIAMGDIYVRYGFPFIDITGGGTAQGMIEACRSVLSGAPADATIIPGHGQPASLQELREYTRMLEDTTAVVSRALKEGKTLEQMKKERVLGAWSAQYSPPKADIDTDAFTETLFNSLTQHRARHGRPGR